MAFCPNFRRIFLYYDLVLQILSYLDYILLHFQNQPVYKLFYLLFVQISAFLFLNLRKFNTFFIKIFVSIDKESISIITKHSPNKIIDKNKQNLFNCGYFFLEKLYYELKLNKICDKTSEKYSFKYDYQDYFMEELSILHQN